MHPIGCNLPILSFLQFQSMHPSCGAQLSLQHRSLSLHVFSTHAPLAGYNVMFCVVTYFNPYTTLWGVTSYCALLIIISTPAPLRGATRTTLEYDFSQEFQPMHPMGRNSKVYLLTYHWHLMVLASASSSEPNRR